MSESAYDTPCTEPQVSEFQVVVEFDGRPGTIARARSRTERFLAGLPGREPARDHDILLVTSELVTNAVRHAPGACTLQLSVVPGGIRVEVHDTHAGEPLPRTPDIRGGGGYGLHLIRALALSTGSRSCAHGKAVAALLPR